MRDFGQAQLCGQPLKSCLVHVSAAAVSGDGTGASGVWKYCAWMVHWKSSGDGTVFGSYHLDAHRWCSGGILLSAMYAYMPNIKRPFWTQLPGASGAAISWAVLSYVISIYMTWGQKSAIYGSLTAVVMIMLWLYFCMWILFAGAQANRMLEEQRMEKKRKYQMEEEE